MNAVPSRLFFACAVFACATLPAQAQDLPQTPGSHITVTQCYPHRHAVGTPGHPWVDPYGAYHGPSNFPYSVGFLGIVYVNDAPSAAKEIDFGLISRGTLVAVTKDVGTFSSGSKIDHEFSLDPEIFPIARDGTYCAVLRVRYADGTEWRNPNAPPY